MWVWVSRRGDQTLQVLCVCEDLLQLLDDPEVAHDPVEGLRVGRTQLSELVGQLGLVPLLGHEHGVLWIEGTGE